MSALDIASVCCAVLWFTTRLHVYTTTTIIRIYSARNIDLVPAFEAIAYTGAYGFLALSLAIHRLANFTVLSARLCVVVFSADNSRRIANQSLMMGFGLVL